MKTWIKRIGIFGFLFFLVKGLLWLILAALVYFGYKSAQPAEVDPAMQGP